jgi:hypothetical protein
MFPRKNWLGTWIETWIETWTGTWIEIWIETWLEIWIETWFRTCFSYRYLAICSPGCKRNISIKMLKFLYAGVLFP